MMCLSVFAFCIAINASGVEFLDFCTLLVSQASNLSIFAFGASDVELVFCVFLLSLLFCCIRRRIRCVLQLLVHQASNSLF
jgi:hypothetical protein